MPGRLFFLKRFSFFFPAPITGISHAIVLADHFYSKPVIKNYSPCFRLTFRITGTFKAKPSFRPFSMLYSLDYIKKFWICSIERFYSPINETCDGDLGISFFMYNCFEKVVSQKLKSVRDSPNGILGRG